MTLDMKGIKITDSNGELPYPNFTFDYALAIEKAILYENTKQLEFIKAANDPDYSHFKVILWHKSVKIEESDWIKVENNEMKYTLAIDLEHDLGDNFSMPYLLKLYCRYKVGEEEFEIVYSYAFEYDENTELEDAFTDCNVIYENSISAAAQPDLGRIEIRYYTSSEEGMTIQRAVYGKEYQSFTPAEIPFFDSTVESGVFYTYKIRDEITDPVMVLFEDMYLSDKDKVLKIRYNPSLNSIKYVMNESITNTLGSKYPFVRRNGNTKYRQFTIGGLISCLADDQGQFLTKQQAYGDQYELLEEYEKQHQISEYTNEIYERKFRDKVIEFLHSGNVMLFRSTHEGNMLVRLTNIQLTPDAKLGRRIYSFSAQATEIADCTVENLKKFGFLEEA